MTQPLLIRIYSFSYRHGEPFGDPTGNGGGFVFDCRCLQNPGREPELQQCTGLDEPVCDYFANQHEQVNAFLSHCFTLISSAAKSYTQRGFSDLQVAFGCTGGRHRSVYCANAFSDLLTRNGFTARVIHWQLESEIVRLRTRRAMVLAAGFGTRLQPLTDTQPKVLLKAGGKPMLDWCCEALLRAGCRELVINAHHLAGQIEIWAENYRKHHPEILLTISYEDKILGTGGGIRQAAKWLHGPEPVLIHNGDIYSEINLSDLYHSHHTSDEVTLVCQERTASSYLLIDSDDRLCGLYRPSDGERLVTTPHGSYRRLGFTGIHLVSHCWLERLATYRDFSIIESYLKAVTDGVTIRAVECTDTWFDMGNPERLQRLDEYLTGKKS